MKIILASKLNLFFIFYQWRMYWWGVEGSIRYNDAITWGWAPATRWLLALIVLVRCKESVTFWIYRINKKIIIFYEHAIHHHQYHGFSASPCFCLWKISEPNIENSTSSVLRGWVVEHRSNMYVHSEWKEEV